MTMQHGFTQPIVERPTPETDLELDRAGRYLHGEVLSGAYSEIQYVLADFARRLERERDALRATLRELVRIDDLPGMCMPGWEAAMDRARALLALLALLVTVVLL